MDDNTWPSVPEESKLSAANCEQRIHNYINYEKRLHV